MSPQLSEDIALLPAPLLHLWESLADISTAQSFDPDLAFSLHSLLSRLDPPIAQRWHWKDTRKVLRSLEIIQENGCRASDLVSRQAEHRSDPRSSSLALVCDYLSSVAYYQVSHSYILALRRTFKVGASSG
jgi:tRNA dimethylallyltransferase